MIDVVLVLHSRVISVLLVVLNEVVIELCDFDLPLLAEIDLISSSASLSRDCALTPINGPAETGAGLLHFLSHAADDTSDRADSFSSEQALLTSAACLNSLTLNTALSCRSSLIVCGLFGFELARNASIAAL